jgi:hypothetical protein
MVNSAYYCDVLRPLCENVQRLRPELWEQKNWLLHHNVPAHTSLFTRDFFTDSITGVTKHYQIKPNNNSLLSIIILIGIQMNDLLYFIFNF